MKRQTMRSTVTQKAEIFIGTTSGRRGHRGECRRCIPPPDLQRWWHDTWFHWISSAKIFLCCTLLNR